ncbi:unnamed protein product [Lathyrus sativus]|nr:unnamed protein product [Lathyrus sativus]
MDSDNSDNYVQEFWELVEEEFMYDSDEEQQLQNEVVKKGTIDYSMTTSRKTQYTQMFNFEEGSECIGMYFFEF